MFEEMNRQLDQWIDELLESRTDPASIGTKEIWGTAWQEAIRCCLQRSLRIIQSFPHSKDLEEIQVQLIKELDL